jgi:formyltetrahydrofolate synthetase
MEEFNLHLTGDIHAVAAANNLLGDFLSLHLLPDLLSRCYRYEDFS